jgi:tRNA A-37 threonylcarbamoyl transferase component Bud32/tetratricopeptide (TPR) repeat protein
VTNDVLPSLERLSLEAIRQIDEACEQFERCWSEGRRPHLEDYLAAVPTEYRDVLLRELIKIDVPYRIQLGERPQAADYPAAASPVSEGTSPRDPDDTPPPLPGYGDFTERLGGGMGVVWLCRDKRLNRPVAVKVTKSRLRHHPHVFRRFVEEAQLTSQLQHPNIPPVHEVGELPDGRRYFVMKWVQGHTLSELLKARPDSLAGLPRFLHIFEQVCQAVAYAHSQGVIHRDLKPANVMVGAFGEVQVMDWGLAKVLSTEQAAETPGAFGSVVETVRSVSADEETQLGTVLGTYSYMSPEQARGEVDRLDRRCDVFGLGAVLCEILTGQPPCTGSKEEVKRQARLGPLPDALERLERCGADAELVELARSCLRPHLEERPAAAGEVAAAVGAYLAGVQERLRQAEIERAAAAARVEEARAKVRAERRLQWVAVALALAVIVGLATTVLALQQRAAKLEQAGKAAQDRQARRLTESEAAILVALQRGTLRAAIMAYEKAMAARLPLSPEMQLGYIEALTALPDAPRAQEAARTFRQAGVPEGLQARLDLAEGYLLLDLDNTRARELIARARKGPLPQADQYCAQGLLTPAPLEALDLFLKAVEADPKHLASRLQAALLLYTLGRLGECIEMASQTHVLYPEHPAALGLLIMPLACRGHAEQARRYLEKLEPALSAQDHHILETAVEVGPRLRPLFLSGVYGEPFPEAELLEVKLQELKRLRGEVLVSALDSPKSPWRPVFRMWDSSVLIRGLTPFVAIRNERALHVIAGDEGKRKELAQNVRACPEGCARLVYANVLQMHANQFSQTMGSDPAKQNHFRQLLAEAGAAFAEAARTPGLIDVRQVALEMGIATYGLAGKPIWSEEYRPEWVEKAADLLRDRLQLAPPLHLSRMELCVKIARNAREHTLARRLLDDWEKRSPNNPQAARLRAEIEYNAESYPIALRAAEKALKVNPADPPMLEIRKKSQQHLRLLAAD